MSDLNQGQTDARIPIARRFKQLRESLPDELSSAAGFCAEFRIADSTLSMYENGKRPISLDFLASVCERVGRDPMDVIAGPRATPRHPFDITAEFLRQADSQGLDALHSTRASAMTQLLPHLERMHRGQVCITTSSMKGYEQNSTHPFVKMLARKSHELELKLLLTHPSHVAQREQLEGRPPDSIALQIILGTRWALKHFLINPDNIRFVRAAPTAACLFLEQADDGIGLVNPYPLMREAYLCPTLIVRRTQQAGHEDIYRTFFNGCFHEPFESHVVVHKYEEMITAFTEQRVPPPSQALKDEAAQLRSDLRDRAEKLAKTRG